MKRKYVVVAILVSVAAGLVVLYLFLNQPQAVVSVPLPPPVLPPGPEPHMDHPCSNLPEFAKAYGARLKFGC